MGFFRKKNNIQTNNCSHLHTEDYGPFGEGPDRVYLERCVDCGAVIGKP